MSTWGYSYLKLFYWFVCIVVSTFAGSTQGYEDGEGINAKFNHPFGIILNPLDDCLYVCDNANNRIRKVTKSGKNIYLFLIYL